MRTHKAILNWKHLKSQVISCQKCPRLRAHCLKIAKYKRKAFKNERYWERPVPGFGDRKAEFIIVGLAPAAHGANRTGRMFTGDRSGEWLYRALFKAGFANQPRSTHRKDGLNLKNAYITAVVRCAPPQNKPRPKEIQNCRPYLDWELAHLKKARVYLCLGKIAFDHMWNIFRTLGRTQGPRPVFSHDMAFKLKSGHWLLTSYHPSQQNTFTGKLTESMFDAVFKKVKSLF